MSKVVLSAKSGNDWTINELIGLKISVVDKTAPEFFGCDLPEDMANVSEVILTHLDEPPNATKADSAFFGKLDDANFCTDEESCVVDFAAHVLEMMDYESGKLIVHTRQEIPFVMCGRKVDSNTDVCVRERGLNGRIYLVVQEEKRYPSKDEPEPRLIAQAIAAFYANNACRRKSGQPEFQEQVIPGITMVGTAPVFYKIPVTQSLMMAVMNGHHPESATVVERFYPPADRATYETKGMKPLVNRLAVLKTFQEFKQFVF